MRADLFLFNSSFTYKDGITLDNLITQIKELNNTIKYIKEHNSKFKINEDCIYKNDSIYYLEIYQNYTISNFLFTPEISINIPHDIKKTFMILLDRANTRNLNEQEVVDLVKSNSGSNLNGLLILHSINLDEHEIDSTVIIKTKEQWYKFHRYFLAKNPIDELNFYNEARKYFTQINFHPHVEISLGRLEGGLERFAGSIIYNLAQLNDKFKSYRNKYDLVETLRRFSSECNVDASLEGNADKKPALTFVFTDDNSNPVQVCCEPHLKLSKSDSTGDTHFYYNRIYFHEGKPNIDKGKILVAHIGNHL
ncbi:MAG: hypothetical protein O8C66_01480 [Candidatus Methanoperedens sp.]|nr:hypothetical protein [Candidatus Methanoperedens sp.]MCZ7369159.1 hypothetical protein [Candidatus Methanoperedens sp.]